MDIFEKGSNETRKEDDDRKSRGVSVWAHLVADEKQNFLLLPPHHAKHTFSHPPSHSSEISRSGYCCERVFSKKKEERKERKWRWILRKKIKCAYELSWPTLRARWWWPVRKGERNRGGLKTETKKLSGVRCTLWSENHISERVFLGHLHTVTARRKRICNEVSNEF